MSLILSTLTLDEKERCGVAWINAGPNGGTAHISGTRSFASRKLKQYADLLAAFGFGHTITSKKADGASRTYELAIQAQARAGVKS